MNLTMELEKSNIKVRYPNTYTDEKMGRHIYSKIYSDTNIYNGNIYEFDKQLSEGGMKSNIIN